jgi:hypothetical protein
MLCTCHVFHCNASPFDRVQRRNAAMQFRRRPDCKTGVAENQSQQSLGQELSTKDPCRLCPIGLDFNRLLA